jgi:tetratricopeptide (TPR) repeat protein
LKLGRYEEAAQWATEAIPRDPSRAIGWELLGASRGQLGDYRAASEAFQKVVEIEPNRPGAQQQLGLALERFAAQAAPLPPAGQGTPDPSDDSTGDDASGTGKLQHGRQH